VRTSDGCDGPQLVAIGVNNMSSATMQSSEAWQVSRLRASFDFFQHGRVMGGHKGVDRVFGGDTII
jgi:hypothetical protein